MRTHPTLSALIFAALLLALTAPDALAADPNQPAANEVILHADPYFGAGAAFRFRLEKGMPQLMVPLKGHLLDRNFRSVQVGSQVLANVYRARPDRPNVGYEGKQILASETNIDPRYSILVVNRKQDGRAQNGYRDLPLRVTVFAEWSTFLGGGHLHLDEHFVGTAVNKVKLYNLSSVLLPEDQGADSITLHAGRYPVKSMKVVLFDQLNAKGTNARIFPTYPAYGASYGLWSHGYGDKARSLHVDWVGNEFDASKNGGGMVTITGPMLLIVPDVKGFWLNGSGMRYEFGTNGKNFAWKLPAANSTGQGFFKDAKRIEVRWTTADGVTHGPLGGTVEADKSFLARKIVFDDGQVLVRQPLWTLPTPPKAPSDLTGTWNSQYGQVVIQHQGATITGTLHYANGGTASLQGAIQGQTIQVTWFANPLAHGTGTFTIAANGKQLSGPFVDVVSKGSDTWVLTR